MKSVKYLQMVRAGLDKKTDERVAEKLGVSKAAIGHYMTGRRVMDDETCLAVALALNISPMEVIGAACIDRAEKTGQKSLWEVFMSRTATTAATLALASSAVTLFLTPHDAEARTYGPTSRDKSDTLYIMSNRLFSRRLRRTISAWLKRLSVPSALQPATS